MITVIRRPDYTDDSIAVIASPKGAAIRPEGSFRVKRGISKRLPRHFVPRNDTKVSDCFPRIQYGVAMTLLFLLSILIYPTTVIGKEKKGDYSIIYERNIFAAPLAKKEIKSILKPEEIPLSERLLLKGVIIRGKGPSLAVIENRETKRENLYRVGDILLEGEIILIEENRVVIRDKKNKEVTLFFAYAPDTPDLIRGNQGLVLLPSQGTKVVKIREILKKLKAKLPLLSRVRVKPALASGKVNGYQVANIPTDPFFEAIGIKNEDIIRRVNGTLITSIPKAYEIYRSLKPNSMVKVDIVRDGKQVTLNYRLE